MFGSDGLFAAASAQTNYRKGEKVPAVILLVNFDVRRDLIGRKKSFGLTCEAIDDNDIMFELG